MSEQKQAADNIGQKHRYRYLMAVEVLLVLVTVALARLLATQAEGSLGWWLSLVVFMGLCYWHIVVIPVCCFYLIGNPIVMSLSPLIASAESRAYYRELRQRPQLDDDDFYDRFYKDSGIPKDIPIRTRRSLANIDQMLTQAHPSDKLYLFDDELDFADVLYAVGREFGVRLSRNDYKRFEGKIDGTLDNLIQLVQEGHFKPQSPASN